MKVLLISKDDSLFKTESPAFEELLHSASLVDQIHVIVFTKTSKKYTLQKFGEKLFLYPTNSITSSLFIYDALKIAEKEVVFGNKLIVDLISAEEYFSTAITSYILSKKYKNNFVINITENFFSESNSVIGLFVSLKKRIAFYVLGRANGIRVASQLIGESICSELPLLEEKIYILPLLNRIGKKEESLGKVDLKSLYPNFNLFLLSVIESDAKIDLKQVEKIMKNLRLRYPRMGLIVLGKQRSFFKRKNLPYIIYDEQVEDIESRIKSSNIYLDTSISNSVGGAITSAVFYGCPVVASETEASRYVVHDKENGFIANPYDIADFSGKIVQILETPGLKEQMRLMRTEVEKILPQTNEDYWKGLAEIWNIFASKKDVLKPDTLETYASNIVHTLKYTRDFTEKVREEIRNVKIITPNKPLKKRHLMQVFELNQILDVDAIMKRNPDIDLKSSPISKLDDKNLELK
ncbi:MAG: glycosyltransferase [bacterium]|nr:glycosyltransferase [bacterium]